MFNILKVMADNKLDAIVHKTVEHQPTLIKDGINPPYPEQQGRADIEHVPGLCGLDDGAVGIYDRQSSGRHHLLRPALQRAELLKLAYAYEQATHHRVPPKTTPPLGTARE